MYKVLIIDDELLIRTNLKIMIDWNSNGFSICGEASNGVEALEIAQKEKPDIFLSDLHMPIMDGLQLSSIIKDKYPNSKLIVLSNYDDFEYVRGTLKNGAVDYILKHELNDNLLLNTLVRATKLINNSSINNDVISNNKTANTIITLKKKFIVNLLTGFYKNIKDIESHLKSLNIRLDIHNVIPIVLSVDNYHSIISKGTLKNTTLLNFSITNIIEEILTESGNGEICHLEKEKFILLFSFSNIHSLASIDESINSILNKINGCMQKFLNLTATFSIGDTCYNIMELSKSFEKADNFLVNKFYMGKNSIIKATNNIPQKNILSGLDINIEKQLIANLQLHNREELKLLLDNVFNYISLEKLNPKSSQLIFNDLLSIINRTCKENSIELSLIYSDKFPVHELLSNFETLNEIHKWFLEIFEKLLLLINPQIRNINSEYVREAINYIKEHYYENISLTNVAEAIGISNVYLSKLFSAEMSIGFSAYLCEYRIEKAKVLLAQGVGNTKKIIKTCGFNNYAYFFNTFKKKVGITPKEYIRKYKNAK